MPERTKRLHAGLVAAVVLAASSCIGHHTAAPLERIEQIMALPFPVAYHRVPVDLKGWVTLSDPTTNLVCLEDGTGAARVILPFLNIDLRMGNTLEIIGEVNEGGPTPTIVASEAMLLEGTHEPLAPPVQVADLTAGRTGFRYVAVKGVLRSWRQDRSGHAIIRLGSGATAFEAAVFSTDLANLTDKIGSRIRIRAVANLSRDVYGRTALVQMWVPRNTDVEVLSPAPQSIRVQNIREVAALPGNTLAERALHLHGSIQSDGVREELRLEDDSGSIRIRPAPNAVLPVGEVVDVAAFAELDGGELKITDARLVEGVQANPGAHPADQDRGSSPPWPKFTP